MGEHFKDVFKEVLRCLRKFQGFWEISRSFKPVSNGISRGFNDVSSFFYRILKGLSRVFHGSLKKIFKVCQRSFQLL